MGFTEDMICQDCGKTFSCFNLKEEEIMGFTEDMICQDCGKTFSCFFGTNKESFSDFDNIFKNEYGEKAHEQLKLLLSNIENNSEINIDDYGCFSEIKYDLDFKTKYLKKKLDDLAEQIEIQDKERKNKNSRFKFVAETFYWKYVEGFNKLKDIVESGDADLAEQIEIQDKERKNKNSRFKFVAETFYWKYVEGFNKLKDIVESGDAESIEQAFNEKWVLFEGKRFGHTLFKCPNCNKYEAGFYTHVETADSKYECKYSCPECETPMNVYKGCLSDAFEKNEISCQNCGSNNVIIKEGLYNE